MKDTHITESSEDLSCKVRLVTGIEGYPAQVPYGPGADYPEFADCAWAKKVSQDNEAYEGVRRILQGMGLDKDRIGTPQWNPFRGLVPPGGRVTIKPNMVRHWNENPDDSWQTVVTHWAVVRPLVDYALLAVGPKGHVTVGDAPQWDCNMDILEKLIDIPAFRKHYDQAATGQVEFIDFRPEFSEASGVSKCEPKPLPGDPRGYTIVDLREKSMFAGSCLNPNLFYGCGYDHRPTIQAHSEGRHQYRIAGSTLDCDLFINVPKMKTHHLLGITAAMKNLVGINGDKNYLPHFRIGFTDQGGDQYPHRSLGLLLRYWGNKYSMPILARSYFLTRMWGKLLGIFHKMGGKNPYAGGGWIGNDTVWRMTLDLNRVLLYAQKDGTLNSGVRARQYFTLLDGIVAGEGEGPMNVQSHSAGVLIAAADPLICDMVTVRVMGFELERLKLITEGLKPHLFPISPVTQTEEIDLATCEMSGPPQWAGMRWDDLPNFHFIPPTGWEEMLECESNAKRRICCE